MKLVGNPRLFTGELRSVYRKSVRLIQATWTMGQICQRKKNATAGRRKSQLPSASPTLELVRRPLGLAVAMSSPPKKEINAHAKCRDSAQAQRSSTQEIWMLWDGEPGACAPGSPPAVAQLEYRLTWRTPP